MFVPVGFNSETIELRENNNKVDILEKTFALRNEDSID